MTKYTVTITPDDPGQAVTTIRLDLDGTATTVRELRLSPGSGGSLVPGDLPVLDLNQLVAAVLAATSGAAPSAAPARPLPHTPAVPAAAPGELEMQAPVAAEAVAPKAATRKRTTAKPAAAKAAKGIEATAKPVPAKAPAVKFIEAGTGKAAGRASAGKSDATAPTAGAPKAGTAKAGAAKAVRAKASARSATAAVRDKKASPAKATAKKAASSTPDTGRPSGASRSYRKLPDDFEQVLRQAGDSASVIADHYDVPRHTAYGWIRTARKKTTSV
ncbi:hypothetical protein [Catellatospora sichuanensis]|uniref:hypothetical protein n=1 Tax=Catellatospora sichuanensis TaxID=1969805 RepID=UPI001183595A|nr:hypothetical protein [Catellatospora sichuanensis]